MDEKDVREIQKKLNDKKYATEMLEQTQFDPFQSAMQGQSLNPYHRQDQNPREYLHRFLIETKLAGCNVDSYIDAEIKKMLNELER